jgi:hypothetical protein
MVRDRVVDRRLDLARKFQDPARSMRAGFIHGSMKNVVIQHPDIPLGEGTFAREMRLRFGQARPLKPPLSADGARRKTSDQRDLLGDLNHSSLPPTHDWGVQQNDTTGEFGSARGRHQAEQTAQ